MAKKTYVLDTSVYLTDSNCINSFGNNDIVIPLKVLEEIDKHKKRQDSVGSQARSIIRKLDSLRDKGSLSKGVRLEKGMGIIRVSSYNPLCLPDDLDLEDSDNQIIATALSEQEYSPKSRKVVVVSRDINMRVKCDSLALLTEDYQAEQVVENSEGLYTGRAEILVDEQEIDRFYSGEDIHIEIGKQLLHPNQFVMLISNSNDKKTALAKFVNYNTPLKKIVKSNHSIWNTNPRNKEQQFAFDLLMDRNIPVVSLVGKAGSGKTLLALAAGLEQTFGQGASYKKIVVTKPVEPVGKDIGFLPGSMEEKMIPWLAPIQDNLQFLMGDDKATLEMYMDKGQIEVEAMTFIRGRSISNAFIVIDEVQNMTQHEIKTVLTRVGEGTKIVLTGDIEQIDNVYIDATNNGLSYVVERLKEEQLTGHVTLLKGERSKVATIAATKL
ncbi:MAG: phosphate starvation-inducible protein PhoH [Flavobacteriaceae bacterium]|nr:phosphate starvation-inducible protein PhoH [Flavobacteriaceae bacterium]